MYGNVTQSGNWIISGRKMIVLTVQLRVLLNYNVLWLTHLMWFLQGSYQNVREECSSSSSSNGVV